MCYTTKCMVYPNRIKLLGRRHSMKEYKGIGGGKIVLNADDTIAVKVLFACVFRPCSLSLFDEISYHMPCRV